MSKAEERALEVYPVKMVSGPIGYEEQRFDLHGLSRLYYVEGYEQAEKDLQWEVNHAEEAYQNGYVAGLKERLTWHEIKSIVNIADELTMEIENMREGITKPFMQSEESFFKEVLKRYGDGE